jgi:hypothetical protein
MSLSTRKARALWVAALFNLALCPDVRAADEQGDGRALFDAGVKAYQQGRYRMAATAFQEAFELTRRPGLLFSLGQALRRSYEQSREPAELQDAIRYYERYLAAPHEGEHRSEATSWLEQLSRLPDAKSPRGARTEQHARAQLVVAVNVASAKLSLDGRPVPTLPHATDVLPGKHHVLVTADGYATDRREIDIVAGAVVSLNIELRALTSRVAVSGERGAELFIDGVRAGTLPSPPIQMAPGYHSVEVRAPGRVTLRQTVELSVEDTQRLRLFAPSTTRRTASWALIGTGAAALLASGVLAYFALDQESKARALQDQPGAGPAFADSVAKRNGLRLAAAVSGGLGAVVTVSGAISIATEGYGPVRSVPAPTSTPSTHGALFYGVQLSGAL